MMQELATQRSISSISESRPRANQYSGRARSTNVIHMLDTLRLWLARRRQRTALAELAARNDYLLDDIGVSRGTAAREAAKPFWQ
jgi:uncharacterized protein YjiS (DUF1127 family)